MNRAPSWPHSQLAGPSRRDVLKYGVGLAAGLGAAPLLTACGSGSGSSSGSLTLGMTSDLFPALKNPVAAWAKQHGLKVTIREMPSDTGTYFAQMRTELQAGSADIDVFAGDNSWPAQFAANGWLADLSHLFPSAQHSAYLPAAVASNVYKGKTYGVPFFTDVGLLYYRKDLLDQAGYSNPPTTWAELQDMAKKIMSDQHIPNGLTFTGATYEGGTLLGTEFIETCGGKVIDGTTVSADSPAAIKGLETQRSMITSGVSPAAVANYQEGDAEAPFLAGRAVFLRNWAYVFGDLHNSSTSKIHPSQVGITSIPRLTTDIAPVNVGGGWNLYINAASTNQHYAFTLIEFISSVQQQMHTASTIGYLPTRTSVYGDKTLIANQPAIAQAKTEIAQTITPPQSPYYADMSQVMATQFNANLQGTTSPAAAAEQIQKQLTQIVNSGG